MPRVRVGVVLSYTAVGVAVGIPAVFTVVSAVVNGAFPDFKGDLWLPGHMVREGLSPFADPDGSMLGSQSVYMPPPVLAFGVPLSFLPLLAAGLLWAGVLAGCSAASLWLMGVRDWRCYVVALGGMLFLGSIVTSNAIPVTALLLAVAYRLRRHPVGAGLAVGAAVLVKPFAFPMVFWRSRPQFAAAAATVLFATAAAWAAIGFRGLTSYPHLMSRLTEAQGSHGTSVYALAAQLGATQRTATVLALAVAGAVLIAGRGSFSAAILASLLASPIEWAGYSLLLYLVIATQSPRFSPRWLVGVCYVPTILYTGADRPVWTIALGIAAASYVCLSGQGRRLRFSGTAPNVGREAADTVPIRAEVGLTQS
jgi:Glycosyltransferase family 87